ncbi:MAG: polyprenol monophosphomannose synthase [Candidatus Omnitrophica bacterium]|nr:polyprenol monophosphomannose synthase [Candidatus Omnitrophota bacterium]
MGKKTLIIIPTFNEAENVPGLYTKLRQYAPDKDILFVDDNSTDSTQKIIEKIIQSDENVHILKRLRKEGIAKAYISAFLWGLNGDYKWFQQMDADLSHDPAYLPEIEKLKNENQVIIASRYIKKDGVEKRNLFRKVITFLGCWYLKFILQCPINDLTGGFNCWHRDVISGLNLNQIASRGFVFQAELKFMAYKKGFKIAEFPYVFKERQKGSSKIDYRIIFEGLVMPVVIYFRELIFCLSVKVQKDRSY